MSVRRQVTHYEVLGVTPDCSFDELRTAYRRLAREHHPDVATLPTSDRVMAAVNEAWRVLSDHDLRQRYDETMEVRVGHTASRPAPRPPSSPRPPTGSRRQAWAAGVQAQMARLARLAGRSATQTLLIRAPRGPRSAYELVVDDLVSGLATDVENRVRAARAAGAAPLDLGVAATLVGVRVVADALRRSSSLGVSTDDLMAAELLDRMWDILAHELPVQLTTSLGGNPHVAAALQRQHRPARG
ncbi:MAG: J domain-containing protein [Actinomycetota bacterium]